MSSQTSRNALDTCLGMTWNVSSLTAFATHHPEMVKVKQYSMRWGLNCRHIIFCDVQEMKLDD